MKEMKGYIDIAVYILGVMDDDANIGEIREYIDSDLVEWSDDERDDLLNLCSTMAYREFQSANRALWCAHKASEATLKNAQKVSQSLYKYRNIERSKREANHQRSVMEEHFGAAFRGESPSDSTEDAA